jgi:nicotinamidase/pyrazinamidase
MIKKTLTIVVDAQKDFMNKDGALYVPGAEEIKENIKNFMSRAIRALDEDHLVWYTADVHTADDEEISDTPDFVNTFPPHCISKTDGSLLIPESRAYWHRENKIYLKNKFSVFEGNKDFEKDIREALKNIDTIYILGVAGDVCVKAVIDGIVSILREKYDESTSNKGDNLFAEHIDQPWVYILTDMIASIDNEAFNEYLKMICFCNWFVRTAKSTDVIFEI